MDANRDEGLKCLHIAREALRAGDLNKADRFGQKAKRLNQTDEVRKFLIQLERARSSAGAGTSGPRATASSPGAGPSSSAGRGEGLRARGAGATPGNAPSKAQAEDEDHKATPDQRALVGRIRTTENYYEVLTIERSASEDDVRRAYRKLALKLHPDKNKARGADEAFKKVSKAYVCLSDASKRAHYDEHGHEEGEAVARGGRAGAAGQGFYGGGGFQHEVDPADIFNAFFGGNPFAGSGYGGPFGGTRVYRRAPGGGGGGGARGGPTYGGPEVRVGSFTGTQILQALPVLVLVLVSFFAGGSTPVYSLHRTRDHQIARATEARGVPYFVAKADEPDRSYPPHTRQRRTLEGQVESEYRDALSQRCYSERVLKQRYQYFGNQKKADEVDMSSCEELNEKFGRKDAGTSGKGGVR